MRIKVYIIDDHKILVDSFIDYFKNIEGLEVVGFALSGRDAIDHLTDETILEKPDVILQDIGLPDMNGIECTKAILKKNPTLKIIGVSSYMEVSIVKQLMKAGALGYVSKATDIEQLGEAIQKVAEGERFFGKQISDALLKELQGVQTENREAIPKLTDRERDVLKLIAAEKNTKEIAADLFISIHTVETHRKNLIQKFNVRNSVGLVRKAMEFDLLNS